MKKFLLSLAIILSVNISANAAPQTFAPLVEKLSPAVVNISTTQSIKQTRQMPNFKFMFPEGSPFEEYFKMPQNGSNGKPQERKATSLGSGFIIDKSGIIITNSHVVDGADEITITLHDDRQLEAEIIGSDKKIDIAVLKVKSKAPLPFVRFGDSDKMRVGDWIIAIGNPYGLGGSVSAGIISARARDINVGPFDDFLQTDAAINRGNSGGPMFNLNGEVVGINTAIFSPSGGGNVGIGFALPAALAEPIIKQIQQFGKAKRAWLGVKIQEVSKEIAESLGLKKEGGALVLEVISNSPSEKAGVQEGDVILKFNDKEITETKKLPRIVGETPIGERIVIQVLRNGEVKNLRIVLGEMQEEKPSVKASENKEIKTNSLGKNSKEFSGVTLVNLTNEIRNKYNIAASEGLLVIDVDRNSQAAERGIRPKQVILKANQTKLKSITDFETAIAAAKKEGRNSVLLLVNSGDYSRFIPLPIK